MRPLNEIKYLAERDYLWAQVAARSKAIDRRTEAAKRADVLPVVLRPGPTYPEWLDGPARFARASASECPRSLLGLRDMAWAQGWSTRTTCAECMAPPTARRLAWQHEKRVTLWANDGNQFGDSGPGVRRFRATWLNGLFEGATGAVCQAPVFPFAMGKEALEEWIMGPVWTAQRAAKRAATRMKKSI